MRTFPHIIGPKEGHAHQGVRTEADYLALQSRYLADQRAHGISDAVPRDVSPAPTPYICFGQWLLDCLCRNAPSVSVEWDLACCLECGAIYRGLTFPSDRESIERVLVARTDRPARNWTPGETLADLIAENRAHGDQVPDGV